MTKKDYVLIANAIREQLQAESELPERYTLHRLAVRLSRELQRENIRFDASKFQKACGFGAEDCVSEE